MNHHAGFVARPLLKVIGVIAVLILAGLFLVASRQDKNSGNTAPLTPADETITVDGNSLTTRSFILQGLLAGNLGDNPAPVTIDRISALKPAFWRLNGESDFRIAQSMGAKTTFVVSDPYAWQNGGYSNLSPWKTSPGCPTAWMCYEDYLKKIVDSQKAHAISMDFFDVWSEPDWSWKGSIGDLFTLASKTSSIISAGAPNAHIVFPSISDFHGFFNQGYTPEKFVRELVAKNIPIQALSWHEFYMPEDVLGNVSQMRNAIAKNPGIGNPQIHINEYSAGQNHLIPGWRVGWLYYLEKANVDWASMACWDRNKIIGEKSECSSGLDGLFASDNKTPQHIYWVHKAYADLGHSRLSVTLSAPHTVAIASENISQEKISLLIGRYSCGKNGNWCRNSNTQVTDQKMPPANVHIVVESYPFKKQTVTILLQKIPNDKDAQTDSIFPQGPQTVSKTTALIQNSRLEFTIPNFEDGEAYVVDVQ
ncbi:MAG: hypothetical protein ACYC8S_03230 [Minisyncoccota bacterium]